MLNKLKSNFAYSRIFIPEILLLSLGIFLITILFVDLSSNQKLVLAICTLFIDSIALFFIGRKQRIEIEKISSIINSIRKTQLNTASEIKLDKYLYNLEKDIRKMYIKSQNDIKYLKKLEHVRTEFLGNVSHELRTPIFAIQGYLETLMNGAIDDKKVNRSFLEKANHHTQRLNDLLNDLIDISMIESGQMRMSFRYFDICEFLNETVKEFLPHAEEKNIKLILQQSVKPIKLYGDKEKIKQVMVNLIQNAIKYTEKGVVEIFVVDGKGFGKIVVKDSGIGIAENDMDRIFERFYRIDKDRSRAIGGTGLGLAIVKHILDAHGTTIELRSTPGVGSEFSFKLKK
ncbi:sensor histidine kinase [Bacteroidota bacterium]